MTSQTLPFGAIGVLGGTGPQGRGLARRWAAAGLEVVIGSRDSSRAAEVAAGLSDGAGGTGVGHVRGATNADCASNADLVVVAVPYAGMADLLGSLADLLDGTLVVSCVNPLGFDRQGAYAIDVPEGSAALQAARLLPSSTVVAAFHHVSAVLLEDPSVESVDTDVLVLGDDRDATDRVQALADVVPGMRGVYAGRLRNTRQVEAMTANLISVNRRYKAHAGLRVTDV
jgi:NADPH-dependent F420 reductase